jgi:hypothetical protein
MPEHRKWNAGSAVREVYSFLFRSVLIGSVNPIVDGWKPFAVALPSATNADLQLAQAPVSAEIATAIS